jgi:hypothetical protein
MDAPALPLRGHQETVARCAQILRNEGFTRYRARRHQKSDNSNILIGFLIYLVILRGVWHTGWANATVVIVFAVFCTWPFLLQLLSQTAFERWRDELFIAHFGIHQALAPPALHGMGVHLRQFVYKTPNPLMFIMCYIPTTTILWYGVNAVTYRIKFIKFLVAQPILMLAIVPHELATCLDVATNHPKVAAAAFREFYRWGQFISNMIASVGGGTPDLYHETLHQDLEANVEMLCWQLQTFVFVLWSYIAPACALLASERTLWKDFLQCDPLELRWEGGPSVTQITAALRMLNVVERTKSSCDGSDIYKRGNWMVCTLIPSAVALWHALNWYFHGF